jgi:RES domain-containing protein
VTAGGDAALFDLDAPPPTEPGSEPRPDFITVRGSVFRWADYDTPVWSRANSRAGRWHRRDPALSVQYWSYSPEAAWAESLRAQGIRDPEDLQLMKSKIWVGQVCMSEIADLTNAEWQRWLGIAEEELIADDWTPCQDAGERLRNVGANGLVTASAALPGRLNLVLYRRMVRGDWYETPKGARTLRFPEIMLPCQLVGEGHPASDLVTKVNYLDSREAA